MDRRFFRPIALSDERTVAVRTDKIPRRHLPSAIMTAVTAKKARFWGVIALLLLALGFAPVGCSSKIVDLTPVKKHPELLSGMADSYGNLKRRDRRRTAGTPTRSESAFEPRTHRPASEGIERQSRY